MPQKEQQTFLTAKGDENYGNKIMNYAAKAKEIAHDPEALKQLYKENFPKEAKSL